ncbi:MAG: monovalent cation/H+ antiporter complex subunit F [Thiohalophilus sp.]|jgi:multicomponent Na+:H+ antiporter subunit F
MEVVYISLALFFLVTLLVGMWPVMRGPTAADRMLAAQLFGTIAVAILLVLAELLAKPAFRDVALVFALLAAVTAVAFSRHKFSQTQAQNDAD